jgi:hypothetical protein
MEKSKKYKMSNSSLVIEPQNVKEFAGRTGNMYESIDIIAKRADQISRELKEELHVKLQDFASHTDNLEEVFENREQIEISRFFEKLPHPTLLATQEFVESEIYIRKPSDNEEEQ